MRNKKNTRTCKGCNIKKDKSELLRLYYKNGLKYEDENPGFGRGTYICKSEKCLDKVIKKNFLKSSLKLTNEQIEETDLNKIREYLKNKETKD